MNKYELQDEKIKKLESLGYKLHIDEINYIYSYIEKYKGRKYGVSNSKIYIIKDKDGKEISKKEIYNYDSFFEETDKLDELLDEVINKIERLKI